VAQVPYLEILSVWRPVHFVVIALACDQHGLRGCLLK
jgi:hypothetical protein